MLTNQAMWFKKKKWFTDDKFLAFSKVTVKENEISY